METQLRDGRGSKGSAVSGLRESTLLSSGDRHSGRDRGEPSAACGSEASGKSNIHGLLGWLLKLGVV